MGATTRPCFSSRSLGHTSQTRESPCSALTGLPLCPPAPLPGWETRSLCHGGVPIHDFRVLGTIPVFLFLPQIHTTGRELVLVWHGPAQGSPVSGASAPPGAAGAKAGEMAELSF